MAKKRRKLSVVLFLVLLSIAKLTNTQGNSNKGKCTSLTALQRQSLKVSGISKFCDNVDSCECENKFGSFYQNYCYIAEDCVGCIHVGRPLLCDQTGGQTTPPSKLITSKECDSDQFLCGGECKDRSDYKDCKGKCVRRTEICKENKGPCEVPHEQNAIDWKCGERCTNDQTSVESPYFDCNGKCSAKNSYKVCGDGKCTYRLNLCTEEEDQCKVRHDERATDWKCGTRCRKEKKETSSRLDCGTACRYKLSYKICNGRCVSKNANCTSEPEIKNKTNETEDEKAQVCPDGKFACGNQCLDDDLQFVDCAGICVDKATLNNGTCPVKPSHTKLIVGLSVGFLLALFVVSITYNAVTTCKKYKAIQPVDRNIQLGYTEAPSTCCWVIKHIPFWCSDDMRRAVQEQEELEVESNPDYGMEMDDYTEYNDPEIVDYNEYYGDSE